MSYPDDLAYSREHEWVRVDGARATIGITSYAADELGDIVFVELPEVGAALSQFAVFGVVESVKAVSDLFAAAGHPVPPRGARALLLCRASEASVSRQDLGWEV